MAGIVFLGAVALIVAASVVALVRSLRADVEAERPADLEDFESWEFIAQQGPIPGALIECPVCHDWIGYWPDKLNPYKAYIMSHGPKNARCEGRMVG